MRHEQRMGTTTLPMLLDRHRSVLDPGMAALIVTELMAMAVMVVG
jgi:hypothetical protein